MRTLKSILVLTLAIIWLSEVSAEVKLPRIFSSNMVLQQGIEIPVWGWAKPGEKITVSLNLDVTKTKAGKDGKWNLRLPVQQYGGPYSLIVKGSNTIELKNVMIGEVWVCSGQSNMEMRVDQCINAEKEISNAKYPNIRLFTVPKIVAQVPQEDIASGEWEECSPATVPGFSAVGYFFGRKLFTDLNITVGLIHISWGGTVAETWISPETISKDDDFNGKLNELLGIDLKKYQQDQMDKIKTIMGGELPEKDLGYVDGKGIWSEPGFDDSSWKTIRTPSLWEGQGYTDIDGIGWYRKEIILTEAQAMLPLTLNLGKIDDDDITWVNGMEIDKTIGYNIDRVYKVDPKNLKPGKNILAIRVNDTGGGGGLYSTADEVAAVSGNEKISLGGNWKFKISKAVISSSFFQPNAYPTLLYNGMINPIVPYAIKGAIWYQGESNADRAKQYQRVFPSLINDWRAHWGQGDFPFLFVSLANYMKAPDQPGESQWAELREAQTKTLSLPKTGMALAIDIGEANDIHPKNKQDVGVRLALNALKVAYGKEVVNSGPMYQSVNFRDGKAYISFTETGSGLMAKGKYGYVYGFSVAGADKKFHWAKAEIVDGKTVVVYSPTVAQPVAVRYGWADNPDDVNLYNKEGLPANPFRTDNWPGITK